MIERFDPWIIKNISPYFLAWGHKNIRVGDRICKKGGYVIKVEGFIPKSSIFLDKRKITICNTRGYKPCDGCVNDDCPLKNKPLK